ncbi:MAG: phosphate ABC transporter permease PstA [Nitrospinae bacterium]|nr:phosphate ABC transporter permease PstA [Nitrospinota bacterium]
MKRLWIERAVTGLLSMMTLAGCFVLILIVGVALWKGWPALSLSFFTQESRDFGSGGGIYYQAMGTILLMLGAVLVCLPVALGSVLFQTEFLHSEKIKKLFRLLIYSLNGVPTIIFGLVGYLFFGVFLKIGISWITGALILSVMILPTVQVAIQEAVDSIPEQYRETGSALGLTPWQQIRSIIIPQSIFGIITGMLLGLARAAGETAAIMFTATVFSGILLPQTWSDPVTTLQTHILVLAQEAVNPQALTNAWGAGLALLMIVFGLITASLFLRKNLYMESDR